MKKTFLNITLFITSLLFLTLLAVETSQASVTTQTTGYTPKECAANKVVVHYKKADGIYDGVGVVTWGNGSLGSNQAINKSGVDSFGAVIEICVGSDVTDTNGGFVPVKAGLPADGSDLAEWLDGTQYRERGDLSYDRTALVNGTANEIHIYYATGMDHVLTYPPKVCSTDRKVVIHYKKADGIYDGVGAVTWGNGNGGSNQAINKSGVDSFGAVIELCIGADVTDKNGGFVPIKTGLPADGSDLAQWLDGSTYRDHGDLSYDRTALVDGTSKEIHIYYISGMDKVFNVDPTLKNDFIGFDPIKKTGTYAVSTTQINVNFAFATDVATITTDLVLKDSSSNVIAVSSMVGTDETGGNATTFTLTLETELDKNGEYTLVFKNDVTTELDLDNSAPMISYTNKVKLVAEKYNESTDTFLIEKGTIFNLEDYVRLNVVDDRDGSLVNAVVITGAPDTSTLGNYTLKISVTDEWNNTSEKEFKFQVVEKEEETTDPVETEGFFEDYGMIVSILAGLVVLSAAGVFFFKKKI